MADRARGVPLRQGLAAERELGAPMLAQGLPLAAFPGLEAAPGQHRLGLERPAGLVQQRAELHREIVAGGDQARMAAQLAQPPSGSRSQALPELVALIEDPRIVRARPERPL